MNEDNVSFPELLSLKKKLKKTNTHNKFTNFQKRGNEIFKLFDKAVIKVYPISKEYWLKLDRLVA